MSKALVSCPARMLAVYGGLTGLVYVETDAFRRSAPIMMILPLLVLGFMTMSLTMKRKTKYLTAFSFFAIAAGRYLYLVYRKRIAAFATVITLGHFLYLLSFYPCVRRLWHGLAMVVTVVYLAMLYYCFADIFRSIPVAVIFLSIELTCICSSVVAAGSVWHYGSQRIDAHQAALLRFIGLIISFASTSLAIINQFAQRLDRSNYLVAVGYIVAQGLMFFANERAF